MAKNEHYNTVEDLDPEKIKEDYLQKKELEDWKKNVNNREDKKNKRGRKARTSLTDQQREAMELLLAGCVENTEGKVIKLTQTMIAQKVGVSVPTLRHWIYKSPLFILEFAKAKKDKDMEIKRIRLSHIDEHNMTLALARKFLQKCFEGHYDIKSKATIKLIESATSLLKDGPQEELYEDVKTRIRAGNKPVVVTGNNNTVQTTEEKDSAFDEGKDEPV